MAQGGQSGLARTVVACRAHPELLASSRASPPGAGMLLWAGAAGDAAVGWMFHLHIWGHCMESREMQGQLETSLSEMKNKVSPWN